VQALVVDKNWRGTGVGKKMMKMAERWAMDRGFSSVVLTSSVSRSDAHSFHNRIGYKVEATSHLFGIPRVIRYSATGDFEFLNFKIL
jgi:GNAT superfamily N-acetyltransferase